MKGHNFQILKIDKKRQEGTCPNGQVKSMIDLIFCGDSKGKFGRVAIRHGWLYGCQPNKSTFLDDVSFVDLDFKNMDKGTYLQRYCNFIAKVQPKFAVLPDVLTEMHLYLALGIGERIAEHCEKLIIVPKMINSIERLPANIRNKPVILGYPCSKYGNQTLETTILEFNQWKNGVHLLGGTPQKQFKLARLMPIVSADCRQHMNAATYGWYYKDGRFHRESEYTKKHDRIVDLFEISCRNIKTQWETY